MTSPSRFSLLLARSAAIGALAMAAVVSAHAQTFKILTAGAFKPVVLAVVPDFEARSRLKVDVQNDTAGALMKRVQSGESFDVLMLPPANLMALAKDGKVDAASVRPVARVAIGVAVKAGAPLPPLDTVEQFKDAIIRAHKVAYIDPASGGSSGIYLSGLFQRLGIADVVRDKAVLVPGGLVALRVANGEADLAIHQVSEILPVNGVTLAGLLPEAIQNYTTYGFGASALSTRGAAIQLFGEVLASPQATEAIRAKGMHAAH